MPKKSRRKPKKAEIPLEAALSAVEAACRAPEWSSDDDMNVVLAVTRLQASLEELRRTPSVRPTADLVEARAGLVKWAASRGAIAHEAAELRDFGQQSGVYVSRPVREGELLFSIPRDKCMVFACRGRSDSLGEFIVESGLDEMSSTVALALRLVYEASLGSSSRFAAYVAALPATFDTPLAWAPGSLAMLAGPSLRRACGSKRAAARTFCELSRAAFERPKLAAALPDFCDWDDWAWAMGAVITRQNSVPIELGETSCRTRLGLVPLWDVCNHALDAPSTEFRQADDGEGFIELRANADMQTGDQVFMNYGNRSDADLVLHSGFCLGANNPHDALQLTVALPHRDADLKRLVARLLDNANVPRLDARKPDSPWRGGLHRSNGAVLPNANLKALALAAVADRARAVHLMRASSTDHALWSAIDADHDRDACTLLWQLIDTDIANRVAFRVSSPE